MNRREMLLAALAVIPCAKALQKPRSPLCSKLTPEQRSKIIEWLRVEYSSKNKRKYRIVLDAVKDVPIRRIGPPIEMRFIA